MKVFVTTAVALLLCSLLAQPAFSQPPTPSEPSGRRTVRAVRLADGERITLDGVLDEAVWQRTVPAGDFIMQDPVLGGTPTESTEVHFAFNNDHLYMAVVCRDSEPDKLLGNTRKRDEFLSADDRFMWTMDTFLEPADRLFLRDEPVGPDGRFVDGPRRRQQSRVGRHLECARPPQRDRLDDRNRSAVPIVRLRSQRPGVGRQLPAHGAPQERRVGLDRAPAQPGTAPHVERRSCWSA